MILALLSAFILDQAIENFYMKDKFENMIKVMKKHSETSEKIQDELSRQKAPCELVDPCRKRIWEFEEEMLWYNAPLVLAEDEIFDTIKKNYSTSTFKKAKYLFYNCDSEADKSGYQKRMKRFKNIHTRFQKIKPKLLKKMEARIVSEPEPQYAFFIGKKHGNDEGIMYIMQKPFALDLKKGDQPGYVFIIREGEMIKRLRNIFNNEWSKGDLLDIN
jgi:hypothetical protein